MTVYSLNRLAEGDILESTDPRDKGRRVRIQDVHDVGGSYGRRRFTVRNVKTGRKTILKERTVREKYRLAQRGDQHPEPAKKSTGPKPTTTQRAPLKPSEQTLLDILEAKFTQYRTRGQHYYLGGGMSTSHIVVSVMANIDNIHVFWPQELIQRHGPLRGGGVTYRLETDVFKRVQDKIRRTLDELVQKGYVEKIGNTDERRWRPRP